jgi:hypothetical protein
VDAVEHADRKGAALELRVHVVEVAEKFHKEYYTPR